MRRRRAAADESGRADGAGAFKLKEPAFEMFAEGESAQRAIGADHAMTGHDDADRIGRIGATDGARGSWIAKLRCNLAVGPGLAVGNRAQRRPDVLLELGAPRSEPQGKVAPLAGKVGEHLPPGACAGRMVIH